MVTIASGDTQRKTSAFVPMKTNMATSVGFDLNMRALIAAVIITEEEELILEMQTRSHKRWARCWLQRRGDKTQQNTMFKLQKELECEDLAEYRVMMRMPPHIFSELVEKVRPYIQRQNTNYRTAITVEERLSVTLRHLALGDGYASLAQQYRYGRCTVGRIIPETCRALYESLKEEFLKTPRTPQEWLEVAGVFDRRWNFPNLVGAVDGKHIRIQAPANSGSLFFNFHQYFSVVLLAIADGNYEFIYVDVGAEGRTSDAGLWQHTPFCREMKANNLGLPAPTRIPGCDGQVPFTVVGDDAFPLGPHVMKPVGARNLTVKQQIFNYRVSRARRVVENAFGIMATRFRIFHYEITANPDNVASIVLGVTALHNLLRRRCGAGYIPKGSVDYEDEHGNIHLGDWRRDGAILAIGSLDKTLHRNPSEYAKQIRENLANYFLTAEGSIDSQYRNVYL